MSIADWLKYATFLDDRLSTLKKKIGQMDNVRTTTKIVSTTETNAVQEQTEFVISPAKLMKEFDSTSKELRLVRQAIEKANHTVELDMVASY